MTVQLVPLLNDPAQTFSVVLHELDVRVTLRTMRQSLYIDVTCENVAICAGEVCLDRVRLTPRAKQLGFPALSLVFADLRGTDDPRFDEFGSRFVLLNIDETEPQRINDGVVPFTLVYDGTVQYDGSQRFDGTLN